MPDGGMGMAIKAARRRQQVHAVLDHGPALRLIRGEVVLEDAADPDAPNRTLRRARVQWVPDVLLARGSIGQHHHDAATRYVVTYERGIMGARERSSADIRAPRAAPTGMPLAQLLAASDHQGAARAVGQVGCAPLAWCVIGRGTVEGWAECRGWSTARAGGYLMAALDRLAEHYGYAGPRSA